jgi:hypothetical protein
MNFKELQRKEKNCLFRETSYVKRKIEVALHKFLHATISHRDTKLLKCKTHPTTFGSWKRRRRAGVPTVSLSNSKLTPTQNRRRKPRPTKATRRKRTSYEAKRSVFTQNGMNGPLSLSFSGTKTSKINRHSPPDNDFQEFR